MIFPLGLALVASGVVVTALGWRRRFVQAVSTLLAALLTLASVARLEAGRALDVRLWGEDAVFVRVTELSLVFAWAFAIALLLWSLYAWRSRDAIERGAGLAYAGCAFGVLFAGDWLTLFLFWEGMSVFSTIVILRGRTQAAAAAAFRYAMVHISGGVVLLCGIGLWLAEPGHALAFAGTGPDGLLSLEGAGSWLIFVGFLVNAAAWPIAAWLPDAYPAASPTGTVLLGTFTTKTAAFVLIVFFAGSNVLFVLGTVMALYGFLYAFATWNYRRLLAYSLVGQVGFILAAAGAGGELGVQGAAAHAFAHVLYKSLLFMSAGAVLAATGRALGGGHGGLWRRMPWTAACGLVGALAISAVPFTNGFVSKTLVLDAVKQSGHTLVPIVTWILYLVSAAAPLYVGLRFPFLAFSGREEGVEPSRPTPVSMRLAMGATALLCIGLGVWTRPVFDLVGLDPQHAHVYAAGHVVKQVFLLFVGTVFFGAWWAVWRRGRIRRQPDRIADTDVLYRGLAGAVVAFAKGPMIRLFSRTSDWAHGRVPDAFGRLARNPAGFMRLGVERLRLGLAGFAGSHEAIDRAQARYRAQVGRYRRAPGGPWPIGRTVLFGILLLAVYVLLSLVG